MTTVTLEEKNGKTLLVLHDLYPSKEALDEAVASGSTGVYPEQFEELDRLLADVAVHREQRLERSEPRMAYARPCARRRDRVAPGSASGGGPSSSVGLHAASTGSVAMAEQERRCRSPPSWWRGSSGRSLIQVQSPARSTTQMPIPGDGEPACRLRTSRTVLAFRLWLAHLEPGAGWDPRATGRCARGWPRSFCLRLTRWRGTRELPALMLALDRGGSCTGVAYRLPDEGRIDQLETLLRREIDADPPTNVARWIPIRIGGVAVVAFAFVAERTGWHTMAAGRTKTSPLSLRAPPGIGDRQRPTLNAPSVSSKSTASAIGISSIQRLVAAQIERATS